MTRRAISPRLAISILLITFFNIVIVPGSSPPILPCLMDRLPDRTELEQAGAGRFGQVDVCGEVASTNGWLLERAAEGASDGTVVVADYQSAGRGRLGRGWEAPRGSALLCSVLVRPRSIDDETTPLFTLAAAVAMADAVAGVCDVAVMLSWPNDLRVAGRKLGGILAEASTSGGRIDAVVIGCGVNVRAAALTPAVAARATSLEACGADVPRAQLLTAYLQRLTGWAAALEAGDVTELLAAYRQRCETVGRRVRASVLCSVDGRSVEGEAIRIGDAGELVVQTDGGSDIPISYGEVSYVCEGD